MILTRRTALLGLGSLLAAPTVVRASSLMPVRAVKPPLWSVGTYEGIRFLPDERLMRMISISASVFLAMPADAQIAALAAGVHIVAA